MNIVYIALKTRMNSEVETGEYLSDNIVKFCYNFMDRHLKYEIFGVRVAYRICL